MTRFAPILLAVAAMAAPAGDTEDKIAGRLLQAVQAARRDAGCPPLLRRSDLDAVARARAEMIASLPHSERLDVPRSIGADLRERGIPFERARLHVDLNRGYPDPAAAFLESWTGLSESWNAARSVEYRVAGMATARAEDGWIVLAVILLEPPRPRPAPVPAEIEAGTVEAINAIRTARDLVALELDPALADVARAHSRDMIRRGYFDHDAPDGNAAADRVRQSGLPFDRVGENLHRSNGAKDPVGTAVRSWMDSPGHRALVLEPAFRATGVGVAVDDDGTVYFTQLFLAPDPRPVPGPGR